MHWSSFLSPENSNGSLKNLVLVFKTNCREVQDSSIKDRNEITACSGQLVSTHYLFIFSLQSPLLFFSLLSSLHVHAPRKLFCFSCTSIPLCLSHMKTMLESMYRSSLFPCVPYSSPWSPAPSHVWPSRWDGIKSRGNHRIQSNAVGHVVCTSLRAISLTSRKPFVVTLHDVHFTPDKY